MNERHVGRVAARGFTLIEVLLALAIMATLAITGYRALSGMLEGEQRVAQERERWRELDLFFARLEHDLGHVLPRAYRIGDAGMPAMYLRDSALAFVRGTPGEAPQRIGYRWNDGRIELLYWPQLDAPAAAEPSAYPVAEAVESWRISFANRSGQWVERWGEPGPQIDEPQLPRGARIELTLIDGTRIERVLALQ
ncbi:MAG: type II secretion system minor pseudopilin GspJ [Betaproteobacteria bacterium]